MDKTSTLEVQSWDEDTTPAAKATMPAVEHTETRTNAGLDDHNSKPTLRDFWENKRVLLFCMYIFLLPVNFGFEVTTVGKILAMNQFLARFGVAAAHGTRVIPVTSQQILNAGTTIGLFTSAFATGFISDLVGRKKTIMLGCFICITGVLVQYFTHSILMLFGGKTIATFGFGLGHSLGPVFVAELAPVKLRGICLALINTNIVLGQWLMSLVIYTCGAHYVGDIAWRIPLIVQVLPACILLLGSPWLPESPTWLIIKQRPQDAAAAYRTFNGPKFNVDVAMMTAQAAVTAELELSKQRSSWLQLFKGSDGRRTLIIVMVYLSQQFIGTNFIGGYLTYYFRLAGVVNPLAIGQMAYAVQLFGNLCSLPLVDRFGRRPIIVGGMITMTVGLLVIGLISLSPTKAALNAIVAFMVIWGWLYQVTIGAVAYAVGAETPSPLLRQKTYSLNIAISTAVSCAVLQIMPYLINTDKANLGAKVCFVFMGLSLPACAYLYFCLPEMKGRNYAELQEMFQAGVPARKFKTYVTQVNADLGEKREKMEATA